MDLKLLQKELYQKIKSVSGNSYPDYLPLEDINNNKLDYLNNTYCTYSIKNIENLTTYKDSISLVIEVISDMSNKVKVQSMGINIDKLLNEMWIDNCNAKILRSNIYFNLFDDLEDKKTQVTLNYNIIKY